MGLFGGKRRGGGGDDSPATLRSVADALYAIRPWIGPEIKMVGGREVLGAWKSGQTGYLFWVERGWFISVGTMRDDDGDHELIGTGEVKFLPVTTSTDRFVETFMVLTRDSLRFDARTDSATARESGERYQSLKAEGWVK